LDKSKDVAHWIFAIDKAEISLSNRSKHHHHHRVPPLRSARFSPSAGLRPGAALAAGRPESPPPWIRYNEDYSFLANPSERTDTFDFLKYISLGDAGYLSFGGDARERFESYTNETFNSKFPMPGTPLTESKGRQFLFPPALPVSC
jgi:hypothetical protein